MPRLKKQHLKQRPDGRYLCRYKDQFFYGDTEDEALQARDEYKRRETAKEYTGKHLTVQDYAVKWLELHKAGVSVKCYNDYAKQIESLFPYIGGKSLDAVTVDDAAAVWDHYKGYSASTIHRARMLFVSLFDAAIENDLCRKNPFRGRFAQPPKAPAGTHRVITDEEINLIRTVDHRMQLAALIMLYAGLRRGEVLALNPEDINLTARTITVSKAVRFDGNRPIITAPKTASGTRCVPIPDILLPYLDKARQRPASTVHGDIMTDTAFRRAWDSYLHHLTKAAGHPVDIRPHDLRHTYCTILRDAGIDMHQAMVWMGHADEKMILKVYDHVTDRRTKSSIQKLNQLVK